MMHHCGDNYCYWVKNNKCRLNMKNYVFYVFSLFLTQLQYIPSFIQYSCSSHRKILSFSLTYLTTVYKLTPSWINEYSVHCYTHTIQTAAVIIEVSLNITFYMPSLIPFIYTNNCEIFVCGHFCENVFLMLFDFGHVWMVWFRDVNLFLSDMPLFSRKLRDEKCYVGNDNLCNLLILFGFMFSTVGILINQRSLKQII